MPLLLSGGGAPAVFSNLNSSCGPSNPPPGSTIPIGLHSGWWSGQALHSNIWPTSTCNHFFAISDVKAEGTVKLVIPNLSNLRHKVTTSFHTIANLPWLVSVSLNKLLALRHLCNYHIDFRRLAAKTESSKRTNNTKFFSVYIDCNPESESTLWSCEAVVEFRLESKILKFVWNKKLRAFFSWSAQHAAVLKLFNKSWRHISLLIFCYLFSLYSQTDNVDHFSRHFTNKFNFNSNNWGFPSFMEWSEILDPNRGFIKNDRVIVEAHIHVQKTRGVR